MFFRLFVFLYCWDIFIIRFLFLLVSYYCCVVGNVCVFKKWYLFDFIYYFWKFLYIYNVLLYLFFRYFKFYLVLCNISVIIFFVIVRDIFVYCINILKYFIGCLFIVLFVVNNIYLIVLYKNFGCFFSGFVVDVGDEYYYCIFGRFIFYRDFGFCG